jgi:hypothetical protein
LLSGLPFHSAIQNPHSIWGVAVFGYVFRFKCSLQQGSSLKGADPFSL